MDVDQKVRESQALDAVSDRLSRAFVDSVGPDRVVRTVESIHHRFDGRPIRDFVPIFVERFARDELRAAPEAQE